MKGTISSSSLWLWKTGGRLARRRLRETKRPDTEDLRPDETTVLRGSWPPNPSPNRRGAIVSAEAFAIEMLILHHLDRLPWLDLWHHQSF